MLQESDLTEIEVTEGEEAVRISENLQMILWSRSQLQTEKLRLLLILKPKKPNIWVKNYYITNCWTFYRRPAPDKDPYVKVGDVIDAGQIVCIVEAMKMMNEIKSEFSGKIVSIEVEDGEPVQFLQDLITLE